VPDKYYLYETLLPAQVLELLYQFAQQHPQHIDMLRVMTAYEDIDSSYITLILDDRHLKPYGEARRQLSQVFHKLYNRREDNHARLPYDSNTLLPLLSFLPRLILSRFHSELEVEANEDALLSDSLARVRDDELLLLAIDKNNERIAEIYDSLHYGAPATAVRMALTRKTGAATRPTNYSLFYIKSDERRVSGFDSGLSSGYFSDCEILKCYNVSKNGRDYLFFVPPTLFPVGEQATLFAQFLMVAPRLFDAQTPLVDPMAVFAIRQLEDDSFELLYLAGIVFSSKPEIEVRPPVVDVAYTGLENSAEKLASLRELLDDRVRDSGYRLHLRPSYYNDPSENERDILVQQLQEIAIQLIELNILAIPRPRLYRFTQDQLPALADVLRVYLPDNLPQTRDYLAQSARNPLLGDLLRDNENSPRIRYLFHANTDRDQAGVHFILADATVTLNDMDPMAWWDADIQQPPMEFWLDPLWALYYRDAPQKSLVFVPHGTRMHPVFHSWGVETMDDYLKKVFKVPLDSVPDRPIYVFDGKIGEDEDLYVDVLDFDKFVPITSPDVLSGLNKNLVVLHHMEDTQLLIERMATALTRKRLEEEVMAAAANVNAAYDERTKEVADDFETDTASLLTYLSTQYEKVIKESHDFAEKAKGLNQKILQLEQDHRGMERATAETQGMLDFTSEQLDELEEDVEIKRSAVDDAIKRSDDLQEKLRQDTQLAVDTLKNTRDNLNNLIRRLQSKGRR